MSDIGISNSVLSEYSVANRHKAEEKSEELGQKAFLKLMITQMENQDPLSPQDQGDFIAQLAQFSSVESLDRMNNNFDTFTQNFVASQALEASSLVGRSVTVPATATNLEPGGVITTMINVPSSTDSVKIEIKDKSGATVDTIDTGPALAGDMVVRWNGVQAEVNGEVISWTSKHPNGLPPGKYSIGAFSELDGKNTQLESFLSANVNSVTIGGKQGLVLNLAGVGAVNLADVRQFNE
jgi:flagellar basal-body rod modification protein FlgD